MNKSYYQRVGRAFVYQFTQITDQWLSFRYSVPGINCPSCGPWSGTRVLPHLCPLRIREEVEAVTTANPCRPKDEFDHYASRWQSALLQDGMVVSLRPGDKFLPASWHLTIQPQESLYESLLGFVVDNQTAEQIRKTDATGFVVSELEQVIVSGVENELARTLYKGLAVTVNTLDSQSFPKTCRVCGRQAADNDESTLALKIEWSKKRSRKMLQISDVPDSVDVFRSPVFPGALVVREKAHESLFPVLSKYSRVIEVCVSE